MILSKYNLLLATASAKSRAPLYVGLGLLAFGLILIAVGLHYRRRYSTKDKAKSNKTTVN